MLPRLHILNKKCIPDLVDEIVVAKGKEYLSKGDSNGLTNKLLIHKHICSIG